MENQKPKRTIAKSLNALEVTNKIIHGDLNIQFITSCQAILMKER